MNTLNRAIQSAMNAGNDVSINCDHEGATTVTVAWYGAEMIRFESETEHVLNGKSLGAAISRCNREVERRKNKSGKERLPQYLSKENGYNRGLPAYQREIMERDNY